jgi:hypothetical protein
MALKLIANYSKRLGLPGYSSHQFSVCVETEITTIDDVAGESSRLYQTLQRSVDEEIQQTGFVPDHAYGLNGETRAAGNGNGHANGHANGNGWACSDKQRELILKLVEEGGLDRKAVDETSRQMFGAGVKELNRLQASGLIDQLIEESGGGKRGGGRPRNGAPKRPYANGGAR